MRAVFQSVASTSISHCTEHRCRDLRCRLLDSATRSPVETAVWKRTVSAPVPRLQLPAGEPPMPNISRSDARVKALRPRPSAFDIRDAKLKGFGVRVMPSGARRFFIHTQHRGTRIWKMVGDTNAINVDEARARAASLLAGSCSSSFPLERGHGTVRVRRHRSVSGAGRRAGTTLALQGVPATARCRPGSRSWCGRSPALRSPGAEGGLGHGRALTASFLP